MFKLAVFASHQGSNFKAIVEAFKNGTLCAEVVLLISNNSNANVISTAKEYQIPFAHVSEKTHPIEQERDRELCSLLEESQANLIILAGYMKKLGHLITEKFQGRIINVHPSLLPKYGGKGFYGLRVHEAVLENKEAETGVTTHLVNPQYDQGKILLQERIKVQEDDTPDSLAKKIRPIEHKLIVHTIKQLIK